MAIVTANSFPWLVSVVLNVLYFWVYLFPDSLNIHLETKYAPSGFCVTNYDPQLPHNKPPEPPCGVTPNSFFAEVGKLVTGTSEAPNWASGAQDNSHFWAFSVDCWFAIIVLSIGLFGKKNSNQGFPAACTNALVIMAHGILHWWLGYFKNCELLTSQNGQSFGTLLYTVFIGLLIFVGFRATSNWTSLPKISIATAVFTFLIVYTSTTQDSIGAIFGGTQLLLSLVSAFIPKKGVVTRTQGYFFIAPCLISLTELLYCTTESGKPTLFNKYGGHAWYDVTLHTVVVLFQLQPRSPAKKQD